MANFLIAYKITSEHEGLYGNNASDEGGETFKGIARNRHPNWIGWNDVDIIKSSFSFPKFLDALRNDQKLENKVRFFYMIKYWDKIRGDDIQDQDIANELYDNAVNMGAGRSISFLQEALNLLNRNGKSWPEIKVDGGLGPQTFNTMNIAFKERTGRDIIFNIINLLQGEFYLNLTRRKPTQEEFLRGWASRVTIKRIR